MAGPGESDTARDRRARLAVAALFLTNGALFANLLPRYPEIKADLQLSNAEFGMAVAAFPAGALTAGLAAATLIRRYRSARVAVGGTLGIAVFVVLAGVARTPLLLASALFVAGACDAITDVAQNAHGLRVQRRYGRSIINSFHAVWSAGAILGGLTGAAAIALGLSRWAHLSIAAAVFGGLVLLTGPLLLPGADHDTHPAARTGDGGSAGAAVYLTLLALVLIAVADATVEDAGSTWATLYLRDSLGVPGPLAASGLVAFAAAMFIGRVFGDRLVDRFGEQAVARAGGFLTAAGMGAALGWPTVPGTVAGFAAAGFGVATLIPAAMHRADQLPGLRPGTGLTVLTWLMRIGFVGAPVLVGVIADAAGLRAGLLTVVASGLAVTLLADALSARPRPARS
ncbi:MAG: MFS transporter [Mycolicibacterium hassiacum]|jgi:MFS family permease|uniref:MFS transporter n=1 Tax=Mycolicibacterium hassiacum TaxID=46351 RepID=UPI0023F7E83B|nr:MFS transporter [Mycolicibacterium hassiacum]MBX5485861.1 MFS transporter [Mycolicibacterium hassiacum]